MAKKEMTVEVDALPNCDLCADGKTKAAYDGKTRYGTWGFMCPRHFKTVGTGTGLGRGQKLVVRGG
jgi:hypothetical protein